jgi:hypothetical protein
VKYDILYDTQSLPPVQLNSPSIIYHVHTAGTCVPPRGAPTSHFFSTPRAARFAFRRPASASASASASACPFPACCLQDASMFRLLREERVLRSHFEGIAQELKDLF